MAQQFNLVDIGYYDIRNKLKQTLAEDPQFLDYDFEGSNLAVLLDVLAYNTWMNNFYINQFFSETFLDTATLRDSIISRAKELNYIPRSMHSAQAIIDIVVTPTNPSTAPTFITMPAETEFRTVIDNKSFIFTTDQSLIARYDANTANYTFSDVSIYEGRFVEEIFTVADTLNMLRFKLTNSNIDTRSLKVAVQESSTSANITTFQQAGSIVELGPTSKVYFLLPAQSELYEIQFGNGVLGQSLAVGNLVRARYRLTRGPEANKAQLFKPTDTIGGFANINITLKSEAAGGGMSESTESIRINAPFLYQVQDRAVTAEDYKLLLRQQFPEITALAVFGGEDIQPPRFGRVVVSLSLENADGIPETTRQNVISFLTARSSIGIKPLIIDPVILGVEVVTKVKYNANLSPLSPRDVQSLVTAAINNFNTTQLNDFNATLYGSQLIEAINNTENSIVSNETSLRAFFNIIPELNESQDFVLNFYFPLEKEVSISPNIADLSVYKSAVRSTSFTYKNTSCFFEDDGIGNLQVVTIDQTNKRKIVEPLIGTVDYSTGKIVITNFIVSSFIGDGIRVFVRPLSNDISATRNQIIRIVGSALAVTIVPVRI